MTTGIAIATVSAPGATGLFDITASCGGETPKGVLFFVAPVSSHTGGVLLAGASSGAASATAQWAFCDTRQNGQTEDLHTEICRFGTFTDRCINALGLTVSGDVTTSGGTVTNKLTGVFDSFIANGVRVNITATHTDYRIVAVFFFGSAFTIDVGTVTSVPATVTTPFQPDAVIICHSNGASGTTTPLYRAHHGLGWATFDSGSTQQNSTFVWSWPFTTLNQRFSTDGGIAIGTSFVVQIAQTATGFTLSNLTATATFGYFAIRWTGGRIKAGKLTPSAGTGNKSVTGLGFEPGCLLWNAIDYSTAAGFRVDTRAYGAMDGSNTTSVCDCGKNSNNVTFSGNATHFWNSANSAAIELINVTLPGGGSTISSATLTSLDADGFTLNFGTGPGTDPQWRYLAFGVGGAAEVVDLSGDLTESDDTTTGATDLPIFLSGELTETDDTLKGRAVLLIQLSGDLVERPDTDTAGASLDDLELDDGEVIYIPWADREDDTGEMGIEIESRLRRVPREPLGS